MVLPEVAKASLILAQMNAELERSLSVNARIVNKERNLLGETTIVGLRAVKEAVRFHDPEHSRPENVPITKNMKVSVSDIGHFDHAMGWEMAYNSQQTK